MSRWKRHSAEKKKRTRRLLWCAAAVLAALAVCFAFTVYCSHRPYARQLKSWVRRTVTAMAPAAELKYEPLSGAQETVLYSDNQPCGSFRVNPLRDNKLVERAPGVTRLTDFCTGFSVDLPEGMEPDFAFSPKFVRLRSDFCDVVISKERSPYADVEEYISYYLNRFITNEQYRENNSIELLTDDTLTYGENPARIITVKIGDMPEGKKDVYSYVTLPAGGRYFFRLMFTFSSQTGGDIEETLRSSLSSFSVRDAKGWPSYDLHFSNREPDFWSEETRQVYRRLKKSDSVMWGIFASQVQGEGINTTIPRMEQELDFTFPIVLEYNHIGQPLSQSFFDTCQQQGRMIELTLQMTETNNEDLYCKSPLIETYKGRYDDKIRTLARQLKEGIHTPFFFRLNNEMNTDWANYSGIVNLSDPEIYIGCWRRVYEIFREEGVDNAIWVFNPNDRNYPPCSWNHYLAYYPGDEYVQMIGVTGYNTGTYYKDVTGEDWRSFTEIYDEVEEAYLPFFEDFPWIITEFASSSVGGNKPMWIENMFRHIKEYPNIKAAVWFSAPDMDLRPGHEGQIGRPYMLDETPETLAAFREGLARTGARGAEK